MGSKRRSSAHPRFDTSDALLDAPVAEELDLHGYSAAEATAMVKGFLESWSRRGKGTVVAIITGQGKRSSGSPVLKTLVAGLLRGPLSSFVAESALDDAGGAFRVRVR